MTLNVQCLRSFLVSKNLLLHITINLCIYRSGVINFDFKTSFPFWRLGHYAKKGSKRVSKGSKESCGLEISRESLKERSSMSSRGSSRENSSKSSDKSTHCLGKKELFKSRKARLTACYFDYSLGRHKSSGGCYVVSFPWKTLDQFLAPITETSVSGKLLHSPSRADTSPFS